MSTPQKPSAIPVTFSIKTIADEHRSRIEGRPVTRDAEWIVVRIDPSNIKRREVTDKDRETYALEYEAWKAGRAAPGTPVSVLFGDEATGFDQEAADSLKGDRGITTLEQVVAVPDGHGLLRSIQRAAREFLERQARGDIERRTVENTETQKSLQAENAELRARLARVEAQLAGGPSHDEPASEVH